MSTKRFTLTITALSAAGMLLTGGIGFALGGAGNTTVPAACETAFEHAEEIFAVAADMADTTIAMGDAILTLNTRALERVTERIDDSTRTVEVHGPAYVDARAECVGDNK